MYCKECGALVADGTRFCPTCGSPLPGADEPLEYYSAGGAHPAAGRPEPSAPAHTATGNVPSPTGPNGTVLVSNGPNMASPVSTRSMTAALARVKAAWAAYEAIVDWDDWADTGEMDTDEFYAVWTAMDELDAFIKQERSVQGSTFSPGDPADQRSKVLESASRVSNAYHAYLDADHVAHGNVGTRDLARAMNRALGITGKADEEAADGATTPPSSKGRGSSGVLTIILTVVIGVLLFGLSAAALRNVSGIGTIWGIAGWLPCLVVAYVIAAAVTG